MMQLLQLRDPFYDAASTAQVHAIERSRCIGPMHDELDYHAIKLFYT
jgi:hypothetical protein